MTAAPTVRRLGIGSTEILLVGLIALGLSAASAMSAFVVGRPDLSIAATVFCGVFVQLLGLVMK